MEEELITIIDEEGNETLFEILLTFSLDEYEKDYVCVVPMSKEDEVDEDEESDIYVFSYTPDESGDHGDLEEIVDEAEWAACEEVINTFMEAEDLED